MEGNQNCVSRTPNSHTKLSSLRLPQSFRTRLSWSVEFGRGLLSFCRLKKSMRRHDNPHSLVTDKLGSCGAAMKVIGNVDKQETGSWMNNRAENSHLTFRRQERAMQRFHSMRRLQKFVTVHAPVYNHFNQVSALQQKQFWAQPCRRFSRVAPTLFSKRSGIQGRTDTGSHWSDTTANTLFLETAQLLRLRGQSFAHHCQSTPIVQESFTSVAP